MRRLAALGAVIAVLVLLGVAQLVLPGIAEQHIRDRLQGSGQVVSVHVSAFPAIELLWNQADSVVVRLGHYRSSTGHLSSLLGQASHVGTLTASADELQTGLLTLHNAVLHKRGDQLTGTARVTEADIRAALPVLQSVTPVASSDGRLTVRGTASLFGVTATVDATAEAQDGKLVVVPDVPFGGLATITVFSDPRIAVQSVGATPTGDGFIVSATARLR
jgi:LmeA-like phospholipid-binding